LAFLGHSGSYHAMLMGRRYEWKTVRDIWPCVTVPGTSHTDGRWIDVLLPPLIKSLPRFTPPLGLFIPIFL